MDVQRAVSALVFCPRPWRAINSRFQEPRVEYQIICFASKPSSFQLWGRIEANN